MEDLDFDDDPAQLFHMHQHMQKKTRRLSKFGLQVGVQIIERKMEVMTFNTNAPAPVLLDDQVLPSTETFTYLGICMDQSAGG